ncbi:MAG: imidazolonepropionase [Candidatus Eisenbacteria bacterium]|nr:imidazolonepropionase [Candidatus Eisenbacteria bacterium]
MKNAASLIVRNARQVLTIPGGASGGAKTGPGMADLGVIEDGAVAIVGDRIAAVGATREIREAFTLAPGGEEIDASGCVVLPAFVDPHTHVLFAETREGEYEQRLQGRSYMEIAAAGGGIRSSVRAFHAADDETMLAATSERLDRLASFGTGTVEVKTGYALDRAGELRALRLIEELSRRHTVDLVATYLGAHEIPDAHRGDPEAYVERLVEEMIPEAAATGIPRFCDVFCEPGVFTVDQSRRILLAGARAGLRAKIHADEIEPCGGAELAAEVGAVSADHLGRISKEGIAAIARAGVVAVLLPGTIFSLGSHRYAPAREMIASGVAVALATDCNPGSSMTDSMPWVIALACREMGLTPAEAIVAATRNAAAALGLAGERGSLTPGLRADLQVLSARSYAQLPYHIGSSLVRDLVLAGRPRIRNARPVSLALPCA